MTVTTRTRTGRHSRRHGVPPIDLRHPPLIPEEPPPSHRKGALVRWFPNLTTLAVVIAVAVFVWPVKWGGQSTIIIVGGHSMEPTYEVGHLVATWKQTPELGDIVAFVVPDGRVGAGIEVIHRVVDVGLVDGTRIYRTQGDNNANPDPWDLTDADILGVAVVHVPMAGNAVTVISHPLFMAVVAGLLTLLWLWPEPNKAPPAAPTEPAVDVDPELATRMRRLLAFRLARPDRSRTDADAQPTGAVERTRVGRHE